ncbi:hypothetical protein D3C75_586240 [compost metagenome]
MLVILTNSAANHGIRFTAMNHNCADNRRVADHRTLRLLLCDTTAFHDVVVLVPVLFEAWVGFVVHDFEIAPSLHLQPKFLQAHFDNRRAANQNRFRQP